ncbi:hypothetical protein Tco_0890587 [Tanacetum coccineum]|uniref:Uncharacterized protein n=1 Tax=Tanacetum coccineum TaxID=301880 RepID=A0ABQ5C0H8_9ASTR
MFSATMATARKESGSPFKRLWCVTQILIAVRIAKTPYGPSLTMFLKQILTSQEGTHFTEAADLLMLLPQRILLFHLMLLSWMVLLRFLLRVLLLLVTLYLLLRFSFSAEGIKSFPAGSSVAFPAD